MKISALGAALILLGASAFAAPRFANISPQNARPLHFARGATTLRVRGFLSGLQHRFYTLKTRAGQKLRIRAVPGSKRESQLVPLLFVTPPLGHFNGDKTAIYATNSTRAGRYKIEVAANLMASNARSGPFRLEIGAR